MKKDKVKNILIVHDIVHEYRIPIFEKLSAFVDITLAYSESSCDFKSIKTTKLKKIKILDTFIFQVGLFKIIKNFDLVILPFDPHYPQFFIYSFLINKKLIWFGHGIGRRKWVYILRIFFIKIARAIIVYNSNIKNKLVESGVDHKKIFVSNNTIHVKEPYYSNSIRSDFIYIGRIQKRKNILDACIAVSKMKELFREKNITLKIVGNGDTRDIQRFIDDNKLDNIIKIYGGTFDENVIKKLFANALAYVSPGPVGLGVLHSFAYGVPVVTVRNLQHGPEFENLYEYKNCLLYNGSIDELVECLKLFITNPSVSFYLGWNAYRKYLDERTVDIMVNSIVEGIKYEPTF